MTNQGMNRMIHPLACHPSLGYSVPSCFGRNSGHWRSWLARLYDTQEVTGSNPVWPT